MQHLLHLTLGYMQMTAEQVGVTCRAVSPFFVHGLNSITSSARPAQMQARPGFTDTNCATTCLGSIGQSLHGCSGVRCGRVNQPEGCPAACAVRAVVLDRMSFHARRGTQQQTGLVCCLPHFVPLTCSGSTFRCTGGIATPTSMWQMKKTIFPLSGKLSMQGMGACSRLGLMPSCTPPRQQAGNSHPRMRLLGCCQLQRSSIGRSSTLWQP